MLERRYGPGVAEEPEEEVTFDVPAASDQDRQVYCRVARYLGLRLLQIGKGRKPRRMVYRGPEHLATVARDLYLQHRERAAQVADVAVTAYLMGALPMAVPAGAPGAVELPDWLEGVARSGFRTGTSMRDGRKELPTRTSPLSPAAAALARMDLLGHETGAPR